MRYSISTLTNYLTNEFCELFFEYKKHKIMITPFTPEHYEVYIDDDIKQFKDIESLLNQKIDGKSLRLILSIVNVDIA